MDRHLPAYRLVRSRGRADEPPTLDPAQQAVVNHTTGPLLVLAGPGTGKTTTIVETVVDRVTHRGIDPDRVLVLTFSRKAAEELRERITGRLRRTTREPIALTFHSYAYALVRREFVLAGDEPPTLLSGPEQLLEVRRMLRGEAEDGGGQWPPRLRPALATRGFAGELRDFLLRAAERGLDGRGLARLGRQRGRDDWQAAGAFLDRYAARFDLAPVPAYDYAEIIRIAASLLSRAAVRDRERKAYDVVLVDEYQDTDPAQEALLYALAGDGRELIAVGDPDQSIYAFRGADVHGITRFPGRFRTPDDRPANVIALGTCRRSGAVLLAASRRVASRLPAAPGAGPGAPGAPGGYARPGGPVRPAGPASHRDLEPLPSAPPGQVRVITATSASQEATLVADTLRRAHLYDGVPWPSMAVLVRSVTHQVPLLRRALTAAGVPTAIAGDELPLTAEPGARPLLLLLRCALRPGTLDEDAAAQLLTGPLGGSDALGLRRLRRALRAAAQAAGQEMPDEPLATALRDPRELILIDSPAADAARRVAELLTLARETAAEGTAHDTLWAIWDASGLAASWQATSAAGGSRGAAADRDLDAVVALLESAARFTARLPPGSPSLFLDSLSGQEIPGDTLAQRAPHGDAVRILTAHRAKGLEWDVVVVAGVQEGIWPDLRLRSSLLGMDELVDMADGVAGPAAGTDAAAAALASKLLSEERRLFYVAVTRARRTLGGTAAGGEDSEERPSRFLAELAGDAIGIEHVSGSELRWLSLPALTADLRRVAADRARPLSLRQAAAGQLARLAEAGVRGAGPGHWYQLTGVSDPGALTTGVSVPITARPPGTALMRVSPSQVESFTRCGLRWLLEVAAGAGSSDVIRHFGIVIHAAAVLAAEGAADSAIGERIDEVWHHLDFGSAWYSEKQREQAHQMVSKFLAWHRENPRELVAYEQSMRAQVGEVEITGRVDRLERDGDGRAIVVDLKTSSTPVPGADLDRHPQLGVYQLAVLLGAFERLGLTEPGGAELVQVGRASLAAQVRVQAQRSLREDPEPGWAQELVETVAAGMAGPLFEAKLNPGCRRCPVASSCPAHPAGEQVTP
ncbi:MAG TPA: ATP-dependent DNA helicase [Actinobacteria bacterium]|nr:ATP-dependent DNA helicase [Actinomycetota bacterium]